ncbi:unnamed protein product [Urochloa decumbens]|uniref:SCP domain-containing protein n=1 Tax=Urochloa decumbens TaxID=240449 RepID=A0ABC8WH68_9POAL
MAARPVLLVPAMLLAVALLLSGIPPSALASLIDHPLGDLLTKTGTANASHTPAAGAGNATSTPANGTSTPAAPSSSSKSAGQHAPPASGASPPPPTPTPPPPPPLTPEQLKEKEEKEKQRQEKEKRLDAEAREFGRIHKLVSHTNYTGTYKGIAREFVAAHNAVRARYGVPPMRWNKKLARHARRWANHMRGGCSLTHSVSKYSESIFMSNNDWNATATDAVKQWVTEEPIYDKLTGGCTGGHAFRDCGHFAHIVNKKHQWVGCARSECTNVPSDFVVCEYYDHDPSAPKH